MAERTRRWHEGQMVELPKVNPYTIVKFVGDAGNIHIDESGSWHSFWHRQLENGGVVLRHSGGKNGFPDLDTIKRQHERVILHYVGLKVDLLPEDPHTALNFAEAADRLQLEFPGEQQLVSSWIDNLQKVTRDLPTIRGVGALGSVRETLRNLLEGNLGRALNRHKRQAALVISGSVEGTRPEMLRGATDAQLHLLERAHELVSITLGTMQRYNDLEKLQIYWNGIVADLPRTYGGIVRLILDGYPEERLERRVRDDILHERIGVFRKLLELKGQPYKQRAQRFINSKDKVFELWEARNLVGLSNLLQEETEEAEIWKRMVKNLEVGVDFGKYALS